MSDETQPKKKSRWWIWVGLVIVYVAFRLLTDAEIQGDMTSVIGGQE